MNEPRRPLRPQERGSSDEDGDAGQDLALDDDVSLPAIDGEADEQAASEPAELDAPETDETVGLDDAAAEDAAEAMIEPIADVEAEGWETAEDDPVDDDEELGEGQEQGWTEGSEEDESTPLDLDEPTEPEGAVDEGEEGLDDDGKARGELELPPLRRDGDADEEYPEESEI